MDKYRHILLATDFSEHAERAAERAKELADLYQARLTLLHAVEDLVLYDEFYDPVIPDRLEVDQERLNRGHEMLVKLAERIGAKEAHSEARLGYPKAVILEYAEEQKVDLIVVGSHGHRGLARLLGSTARALVNDAPCDVLRVRLPG